MNSALLRAALLLICATLLHAAETKPVFERAPLNDPKFEGRLKEYLDNITEQWLLTMPKRNPAILTMFANRDKQPLQKLLPWSGEFAGKYLTGAVQILRLTRDTRLMNHLQTFTSELIQLQDTDGYIGPFDKDHRLTGHAPPTGETWDAWGHYHILLGLLLWHEESGDQQALAAAAKIGDLLCAKFLNSGKRLVEIKSSEMNHAPIHGLCLLYRKKSEPRYLDLAKQIATEFEAPGAGDYLRVALAEKEFFQGPKPRWESLHPIMGLVELYWLTGDASFRKAFEQIWWSIAKLDRHNNGGFSSGEQAQGNPYHPGAIETCCTIAWMAMSVEMLRLTGNSIIGDELELSMLNSVYGYQSLDGKWCTYDTPMQGARIPSAKAIAFQIRPGSEEINCCSANAPRGFGLLSDWALMHDKDGLILNWYGPSSLSTSFGNQRISLRQETEYPRDGRVKIRLGLEQPYVFALQLRIPHWSKNTRVLVNSAEEKDVQPGRYLKLTREWRTGDSIEIDFDMSPHYWSGEREAGGKASLYRGPILFAQNREKTANIEFSKDWKKYGDLWASDVVGGTATHSFTGSNITWHARKFDDAGKVSIAIDNKDVAVVDLYDAKRDQPFAWTHEGLAAGPHTLKLTILNEKNAASKGRFANVLAFGPLADSGEISLDTKTLLAKLQDQIPPGIWISLYVSDVTGQTMQLLDFSSAGFNGPRYASWLKLKNTPQIPFSPQSPWRSGR